MDTRICMDGAAVDVVEGKEQRDTTEFTLWHSRRFKNIIFIILI